MMQSLEGRFESVPFKAAVIAGLTLLTLWPLVRVENLVSERQVLQHQAYDAIAAGFGGAQIVGAPILTVEALERSVATNTHTLIGTETWTPKEIHLLPDDVQITSDTTVEIRSKVITGQFKPESIARLLSSNAETRVLPDHAVIQLPLSEVYIAGATTKPRSALGIGTALSAAYGALYVILVSDDNALLYGSLLLFAILAALMLATRRLDWAKVGCGE
jgi:inner membrane protein involved in colicin E2 resistance